MVGIVVVAGIEHGGCPDYLSLLVAIHRMTGLREAGGTPEADLHEHEAFVIQHDQVNLATATSEVTGYRPQTLPDKIVKCRGFSAVA